MTKRKPSKKEIESVISGLINHVRHLEEKLNALDSLFGLYLEWKKDKDKFNKFVEDKIKSNQSTENKTIEPGETK